MLLLLLLADSGAERDDEDNEDDGEEEEESGPSLGSSSSMNGTKSGMRFPNKKTMAMMTMVPMTRATQGLRSRYNQIKVDY